MLLRVVGAVGYRHHHHDSEHQGDEQVFDRSESAHDEGDRGGSSRRMDGPGQHHDDYGQASGQADPGPFKVVVASGLHQDKGDREADDSGEQVSEEHVLGLGEGSLGRSVDEHGGGSERRYEIRVGQRLVQISEEGQRHERRYGCDDHGRRAVLLAWLERIVHFTRLLDARGGGFPAGGKDFFTRS